MPAFDGIGANEYIVDVTHPGAVDFISAVETPCVCELNIWYRTLNVGFRTRISGETDFPCIYDDKVGLGRTYAKVDAALTYEGWLRGLAGRPQLRVRRQNPPGGFQGERNAGGRRRLAARGRNQRDGNPHRARLGATRDVPVEIVANGKVAGRQTIAADGKLRELKFEVPVKESSWIAARVLPAAHTNPVFAFVGGKPVRASRASAEWCWNAVNQCWTQKAPRIRASELPKAKQAYDHARDVCRRWIAESAGN